jgi:acetyl/propionyl-CoA carboxylase alpha subunit
VNFDYSFQRRLFSLVLHPGAGEHKVNFAGRQHAVRILGTKAGELELEIDGRNVLLLVAKEGRRIWVHLDGKTYALERLVGYADQAGLAGGERVLRAPMPGQVRRLAVQVGQAVSAGDVLVLLEAMKMEIRIQAPHAAKVARIAVSEGQSVEREQILVELDGEGP